MESTGPATRAGRALLGVLSGPQGMPLGIYPLSTSFNTMCFNF